MKSRIAYILSHINKSTQWEWFAEGLNKNKDISQLYILIDERVNPLMVADFQRIGVPLIHLRHRNLFSHFINFFRIIFILKKHQINTIHTSLPYGNLLGQTAAWFLRIKNRITTCENVSWAHDFNHKKQAFIDRLTFRLSRKIIVGSQVAYDYVVDKWKLPESKVELVYQGIKPSLFTEVGQERIDALRNQFKLSSDDYVIGMVARLEYWKGHQYVIEAIAQLKSELPNIKLLIVGDGGSYESELRELVKKHQLENIVIFGGFVSDPFAVYQLFDIHVHVPINEYVETCGLTIIEGMMASTPQIVTKSGYAYELAKHLENNYVVPFKDSKSIIEGILSIHKKPEQAKKRADISQEEARDKFVVKEKVDRCLKIYTD